MRPETAPPRPAGSAGPVPRPDQGSTLVMALASLFVVTVFATTLLSAVSAEEKGVELDSQRAQAFKFAEGLLEIGENTLIEAVANFLPFENAPASDPFLIVAGTHSWQSVTGTWTVREETVDDGFGGVEAVPPENLEDAVTGLKKTRIRYVIEAQVDFRGTKIEMRRHLMLDKMPIFQFLAFYEDDLEILPGPNMVLGGRIHSNHDIYAAANNGLTVDSKYFRTAGNYYRHRKDSNVTPPGWVKVRDSREGGELVTLPSKSDLSALGIGSANGLDSLFTGWDINGNQSFDDPGEMSPFKSVVEDLFGETFKSGEHGVKAIAHPAIGSIQAFEALPAGTGGDYIEGPNGTYIPVTPGTGTHRQGYYHANAGLVIIDDRVYDGDGNDITALMPGGFITETLMYDAREGEYITITEINVARLGDMDGNPETLDPCPFFPENGLLYATRSDCLPGQVSGVKLKNGSEINVPDIWDLNNYTGQSPKYSGPPPEGAYPFGASEFTGLTVVSSTPVYVQGDYNTQSKKPAAVITDAINLLSNSWTGTKSPGQLPGASDTTYNVAVITGNEVTSPGQYNGGFENLPRFHEKWSNRNCNITGAFANTWRSQMATGDWHYGGDVYQAPKRNWFYDTDFDEDKLPPFTPMVIETDSVAWEVSH